MTTDPKTLRELAENCRRKNWSQGVLLSTIAVRRMTPAERNDADERERRTVCADFLASDEGRSRTHIAQTVDPHDARYIAAANPQSVIALLDALDAKDKERLQWMSDYAKLAAQHEALQGDMEEAAVILRNLFGKYYSLPDGPLPGGFVNGDFLAIRDFLNKGQETTHEQ